jgi:hypothetical protein
MAGILVRDDGGEDRSHPQAQAESAAPSGPRSSRGAKVLLIALVALQIWIVLPWLTGERMLVLRDVVYTHRQFKWFGAAELAEGRIPAVNPTWGLGAPFRGNPNALPFYPGNLFYLLLPFEAAFHLHYALHWLLAFLAMHRLARELDQGEAAALLAAVSWAGSGYLLSLLSFYNLLAVAAWAPLVLWGVARGGRRGIAAGGLACGMMLLGGEPLSAALVVPAMAVVAVERRGLRRGLATAGAVGLLGLAVASPQLVASARAAVFSFRAAHGIEAAEAGWQSLHPGRLLELVLPLPWGWPSDFARFGYWSKQVTPDIPYIYSIHIGVISFAVALVALRRHRPWAALAGGSLLLAWLAGVWPGILSALTGGLFRYPQKLALPFTLAAALLAGWGLEAALRQSARCARGLAAAGAALGLSVVVAFLRFGDFAELLRTRLAEGGKPALAITHAGAWLVAGAIAALLLLAAAAAIARRRPLVVVAIQAVGLFQLAPMFVADDSAFYRQPPPFAAHLAQPLAVVPVPGYEPDWEPRLPYPIAAVNPVAQARVAWFQLDAPFGVPRGLSYPLAPDLEGLSSPLHVFLVRNLQLARWPQRARWLARIGAGWVVRFSDGAALDDFERVAVDSQYGVPQELLAVRDPAPVVRWPERLALAPEPLRAFVAAANGEVPPADAIVSRAVAHDPAGRARLVERSSDRWVIDVESGGGLVVIQTVWHPMWRARLADGTVLATQPVELALLGVEVPGGRHRVTVDVASWPEVLAGTIAFVSSLFLLAVSLSSTGRRGAR